MCENLNEAESAKFNNRSRDALMICFFPFNTLTPKSDKHLISPNSITPKSKSMVMGIKEMITSSKFS